MSQSVLCGLNKGTRQWWFYKYNSVWMCTYIQVFVLLWPKCRKKTGEYVSFAGVVVNINQEKCLRVHQRSLMEVLITIIHLLPDKWCELGIAKNCEGGRICSYGVWSSWIFSKWSWKQKNSGEKQWNLAKNQQSQAYLRQNKDNTRIFYPKIDKLKSVNEAVDVYILLPTTPHCNC